MFASIQYDAGGLFIAGGIVLVVLTIIISIVESLFMFLLRWETFVRCLWAAFLMNMASAIFGAVLIVWMARGSACIWLPVSFALTVLVEGGVLMLLKPGSKSQNWNVSFSVNFMSYLFIILPCVIWPEIINFIAHIFL
jgi:hypothetical protein